MKLARSTYYYRSRGPTTTKHAVKIRHKVLREGASIRQLARELGLSRNSVYVSRPLQRQCVTARPIPDQPTIGAGSSDK